MDLHLGATLLAFRASPRYFHSSSGRWPRSRSIPRRVAIAWAGLTSCSTVYVAPGWGPSLATVASGLTFQVVAQKVVAVVAVATFVYVSVEADLVLESKRAYPEERSHVDPERAKDRRPSHRRSKALARKRSSSRTLPQDDDVGR